MNSKKTEWYVFVSDYLYVLCIYCLQVLIWIVWEEEMPVTGINSMLEEVVVFQEGEEVGK